MIPQTLKLENFMAYSEAELDFRSFRIACLAGHNGAGKSTILDALTWSLFDEARARDSEDLIRVGASEMRVELSFLLEGREYRVIRSRKRKGKGKASGKTSLEFQVLAESGYRSLSGKKIQETQSIIEQTLKMNYGLFVNSSFILQGRADAFTTATPAERKQVLADILQLEAYEKIRLEAQEQRRELRNRENLLRGANHRLEEDLEAESHLSAHLLDSRAHRAEQLALLASLETEATGLEAAREQQRQLQAEQNGSLARQADWQQRRAQLQTQLQTQTTQAETLQRWLDRTAEIEAAHARLLDAEARMQALEADFAEYLARESADQQLRQRLERRQHQFSLALQQAEHSRQSLQRQWQDLDTLLSDAPRIEAAQLQWQQAQTEFDRLQALQTHWQSLDKRLAHLRQQRESQSRQASLQLQQLSRQREELESQIATEPALTAEAESLALTLAELQQKQTRLEGVQARGLELRHEQENLQREDHKLGEKLAELEARRQRLQAHKDTVCPLCERLLTAADLDLLLAKYADETRGCQAERLALQPQIHQLEREIHKMRSEYQHLFRELKPRDSLQTRAGSLRASLDQIHAAKSRASALQAEHQALAQENQTRLQALDTSLTETQSELSTLAFAPEALSAAQSELRQWQWVPARSEDLAKARTAAPALRQALADAQAELDRLQIELTAFEAEKAAELAQSGAALAELAEVPAQRRALQQELAGLAQAREKHAKLQEAKIRHEGLLAQQGENRQQLQACRDALSLLEQELAGLREQLAQLAPQLAQSEQLQQRIQSLRETDKQLHAEIYSLEKELETLLQRKAELEAQQKQLAEVLYEIQLYEVLEESFGKNGLQAVLIENALPEIEQIANDMLAGMSEGRMHIKLQTLKSLKSRDRLAETLDILISDELGTRAYETFSTGEAFRVNFALRLAISKLLARRAGSRLQTLVIDEGFGSQDAQGKTRLIEAINTVAADFATILVITHVDDLKALFPCRIEIHKEAGGSKLKVLHV